MNDQTFRQPEVEIHGDPSELANFTWDRSIDRYFKNFCKAVIEEAKSGPRPKEVDHYVNHYGKARPGYINFAEFKEIFETHAMPIMFPKGPNQEESKIIALFNAFDVQSRGFIPSRDFASAVNRAGPALEFIGRLGNKVRKGGERLLRALTEEF